MADIEDGLATLGQRVQRKTRAVPPPRHARVPTIGTQPADPTALPAAGADATAGESGDAELSAQAPTAPMPALAAAEEVPTTRTARSARPPASGVAALEPLSWPPTAGEPKKSVTMQLRVSLAQRLEDLVVDLRRKHGLRTSQVELVELLVSTLPGDPDPAFTARVRDFQSRAPR